MKQTIMVWLLVFLVICAIATGRALVIVAALAFAAGTVTGSRI